MNATMYTDGSIISNPGGQGGYGVVIEMEGRPSLHLAGGFYAIAQLSSVFTMQRLFSDIGDYHDLRNKVVATVADTTSVPTLNNLGSVVVPVERIELAYEKLLQEKVDAVVFDSPSILYYALNEEVGRVSVVEHYLISSTTVLCFLKGVNCGNR